MKRFKKTIPKVFRALVIWWHWVIAIIAVATFTAALLTSPTNENPTGNPGLFAPIVALCTAAMILTQAVNGKGVKIQRFPGILIGIGSLASAYLWMAAEANIHPADPELLRTISIIWIAVAVVTIIIPLTSLMLTPQSKDQPSKDENGDQ